MAFTELYVQTTGSNLNAGSTPTDASTFTYASGTWVAATGVFTVAAGNPAGDGVAVGDFASVYVDASTITGFVGRVTARDATTITVSLTAVSGTPPTDGVLTRTLKIGGAWRGPNGAISFPFGFLARTQTNAAGDYPRANFKNGVNYAITAIMTHALVGPVFFQGYTTTIDDGGRFTVDGTIVGASYNLLNLTNSRFSLKDAIFQNNGTTGSASGIAVGADQSALARVTVNGIRGNGISLSGGTHTTVVACEAYACNGSNTANTGGFFCDSHSVKFERCISHHNVGGNSSGFVTGSTSVGILMCVRCISAENGFVGYLYRGNQASMYLLNCDAASNASDGVRINSTVNATNVVITNTNFVSNGGYGINRTSASNELIIIRNSGFFGNTSGQTNNVSTGIMENSLTYGVTPYKNQAVGIFDIHLTTAKNSGAGPFMVGGTYTGPTVAYADRGAADHRSPPPFII